jgi:hypothetical protein
MTLLLLLGGAGTGIPVVVPDPVSAIGYMPMSMYFSVSPLEDTVIGDVPMITYVNIVPPQGTSAFIENPPFPILFHDGSNLTFHDGSHVAFHNYGTITPDVSYPHGKGAPRTSFTGEAE